MAIRYWDDVVDRAIEAYRSNKYTYFYGARNVLLTDAVMDALIAAEPDYFSRYSPEELRQIRNNSRGLRGIDCSAFTALCTGDDQWSIGQINNCFKYNSLAAGPTASILFTTWGGKGRHIGLDMGGTGHGQGLCMHTGWESTDRAIAEGRAGILFEPIANRAWEKSGQSNCVNFSGVYSPYGPTVDLWEEIHGGPTPSPSYEGWVGEVYGKALIEVYEFPHTDSPLLPGYPYLALGNLFEVIDEDAGAGLWKIRIADKYAGWIEKRYCLRKTPERTGTVMTDLHLRQNAGAQYKSLRIMKAGTVVQICDTKPASTGRPWYYIISGGIYGFASAAYIK